MFTSQKQIWNLLSLCVLVYFTLVLSISFAQQKKKKKTNPTKTHKKQTKNPKIKTEENTDTKTSL